MPYCYILFTSKNSYYIGSTNDIDRRLKEHNFGKVKSTKDRLPVKFVFKEYYNTKAKSTEQGI